MRPEAECSPSLDTTATPRGRGIAPRVPESTGTRTALAGGTYSLVRAVCSDSGMARMAGLGRSHAKQQGCPRWHEQQTVRAGAIATRGVGEHRQREPAQLQQDGLRSDPARLLFVQRSPNAARERKRRRQATDVRPICTRRHRDSRVPARCPGVDACPKSAGNG